MTTILKTVALAFGFFWLGLLAAGCTVTVEHGVRDRVTTSPVNDCTPMGEESCDGESLDRDEDCDGVVDEGCPCVLPVTRSCGFREGDCNPGLQACRDGTWSRCEPEGGVEVVFPMAETCDGQDEDCDSHVDEDVVGAPTYYRDIDGDGFGDPDDFERFCRAQSGYVERAGDCADDDASRNPDAREVCGDGLDNDCDGVTDWGGRTPVPIFPPNGYATGSALAPPGVAVADHPLRPRLMWEEETCAPTYQVQMDDSCAYPGFRDCAFESPELDVLTTASTFRPAAPLPVLTVAPVGRRYAWRVRGCDGESCGEWSEPRYLDVGRQEHDYNGDGYADVAAGAPAQDGATGVAYVYYGNADGLPGEPPLDPTRSTYPSRDPSLTLENPTGLTATNFGDQVLAGGDVNGDGYADLIVGASRGVDRMTGGGGKVYVYHGSAAGLPEAPSQVIDSPTGQLNGYFGTSAANVGDVNGDGFADLVVGSRYLSNPEEREGGAYLFYGSPEGLRTDRESRVSLDNPMDQASGAFAASISGGQDLNGDGYTDIAVGARDQNGLAPSAGATYLYYGGPEGISEAPSATLANPTDPTRPGFGAVVSMLGDANGDGFGDLISVVPRGGAPELYGALVYVYHGAREGLAGSPAAALVNPQLELNSAYAYTSSTVTSGDMNGDGYRDLVIGDHYAEGSGGWRARVYFFHGSATGLPGMSSSRLSSPVDPPQNGWFGGSLSCPGDVNGDGYLDLLVSESQVSNPQAGEGAFHVYLGRAGGLFPYPSVTIDNPRNWAWVRFGSPLASAADLLSIISDYSSA